MFRGFIQTRESHSALRNQSKDQIVSHFETESEAELLRWVIQEMKDGGNQPRILCIKLGNGA